MKKIFWILTLMLLCSCNSGYNGKEKTQLSRNAYLNSLDSTEIPFSLIFWTSDTAYTTNPELMLLLDTFYQHVRTDSFPMPVRDEERWMATFRQRLSCYYDIHQMGSDTISEYAKADSVLNEGVRLIELDEDWSTMGAIVKLDVESDFDRLKEYGLLSRFIDSCEEDQIKDLIYEEWSLYEELLGYMYTINSGIVHLHFWGGSITGPKIAEKALLLSEIRNEMYENIIKICNRESINDHGVYLNSADLMLFDCLDKTIETIINETKEGQAKHHYMEDDEERRYYEEAEEVKNNIEEMRPLVKKWIAIWEKLDEDMAGDAERGYMERVASSMLLKWASLASSRW